MKDAEELLEKSRKTLGLDGKMSEAMEKTPLHPIERKVLSA